MSLPTGTIKFSDMRAAASASNASTSAFRLSQMQNYHIGGPSNGQTTGCGVFRGVERRAADALQSVADTRGALVNAWSTRLVRNGYTGPALQVRRGNDDTTCNIYATTVGDLYMNSNGLGDTLATFLGSNTGYVTTWYDQVGSNHGTQAQLYNQPLIARASTCNYVLQFSGNGVGLAFPPTSAQSLWVQAAPTSNNSAYVWDTLVCTGCNDYGFRTSNNNMYGGCNASNDFLGASGSTTFVNGVAGVATLSNAAWQGVLAARGVAGGPMSNLTLFGAPSSNTAGTLNNRSFVGQLAEVMAFSSAVTSAPAVSALNAVRSFVPVVPSTSTLSTFADAGASYITKLPARATGGAAPFPLRVGALTVPAWDYALLSGPVTLSTQAAADALFTTTQDVAPAWVFVNGDLMINSGVTLQPSVRKLFTVLYVNGNLTHNGTISMSQRGANHSGTGGSAGYVTPVDLPVAVSGGCNIIIPATDAPATQDGAGGTTAVGVTGASATSGGTGAGGAGAHGGVNSGTRLTGAGGTCFSGGAGIGGLFQPTGSVTAYSYVAGSNGGAGAPGYNLGGTATSYIGGGAGNPGGAAVLNGSAGGNGTGGTVIVICTGRVTGSGTVTAAGAAGGSSTATNTTTYNLGGGGSGGGSVLLMYGANSNNNLALSAAGGAGGTASGSTVANRAGGAGGAGSTRMLQMALPTLERACALFIGILPAQTNGAAASFPLMAGSLSVPFDYALRTGPVTLSVQSDADALFTNTQDTNAACIFIDGDLTVNSGITVQPSVRKLFTLLYVRGNLIHNGTLSMSSWGANHSGVGASGGYTAPVDLLITGGGVKVPAAGGVGSVYGTLTLSGPRVGQAGTAGSSGGTGGGATGGCGNSGAAVAAAGTCFCGGTGTGGVAGSQTVTSGTNGGAGGAGSDGGIGLSDNIGGGAGNPGGAPVLNGTAGSSGAGGTLIVICTGSLTGTGTMTSSGAAGGSATVSGTHYQLGGGGSGGGSITALYGGSNASTITMTAAGGAGGTATNSSLGGGYLRAGGVGGAGSTRVLPLTVPATPLAAAADLWLDASDGNTVTLSGSAVTAWADKVAGYSFTQATGAAQPAYAATALNGLPGVQFSGAQYLQGLGVTPSFAEPFTVFFVISSYTGGLLLFKTDSGALTWSTTGQKKLWMGNGTITETSTGARLSMVQNGGGYSRAATSAATAVSVVALRLDSATTTTHFVNGAYVASSNNSFNINVADIGDNTLCIGGPAAQATQFSGTVHEIIRYNTALPNVDVSTLTAYLTAKWVKATAVAPTVSPILGAYGISPWGTASAFADTTASWVWNVSGAATTAANSVPVVFENTVTNNTGAAYAATLHIMVDNYAIPYLNGVRLGWVPSGGWTTTAYTKLPVTVPTGTSVLRVEALNSYVASGNNPAGLIYSLIRASDSAVITNSGSSTSIVA